MTAASEYTGLSIGLAAFGAAIALAAGGAVSEATPRTAHDHSSFVSFSASCMRGAFPIGGRIAVGGWAYGNGPIALGGGAR